MGFIVLCVFLISEPSFAQGSQVEEDIDLIINGTEGYDIDLASIAVQDAFRRLTASPTTYVAAIEGRILLPDNANLINYPAVVNSYNIGALIGLLNVLGVENIGRAGVVSTLVTLNAEVVEDIAILKDELVNNPPVDTMGLEKALLKAEFLYIRTLQLLGRWGDDSLLLDAIEQYDSQGVYVQIFIEAYSITVSGAFPPL